MIHGGLSSEEHILVTMTGETLQRLGQDGAKEKDGNPPCPAENLSGSRRCLMVVARVRCTSALPLAVIDVRLGRSQLLHCMHGDKDECAGAECQCRSDMLRRDGAL